MQLAVGEILHALLEFVGLIELLGRSVGGEQLHVDGGGKGCDLLLVIGKLRQLGSRLATARSSSDWWISRVPTLAMTASSA